MYSPMHDDDEDDPAEVAVAPSAPSAVPPPARPGPPPAPASSAFRRARQLFQQLEAKGGGGSGAAGGGAGTAGGGTAGTAVAAAVAAQPAAPSVKAQFSSLARPTATLVGASSKSLTGWVQFGEELASTAAAAQPRIPAHGDSSADESEASSAGEDRPLFKAPSKTSVGEGSRSRASSKASSKSASSWTSTRTSTSVASVSARSSSSTSLASSTAATGAGNGRPSSASSAAYSEPSAVERFHDAFEIRSQSGSGIALGGSGIAANATHASASRKVSTASASSHGSARQQQQPPTVEICAASFETSRDTPLAQMAASAEDPFASPPADPFQDQEVANTDPFALPHDAPHLLDPFHERPALRSMRGSFESSSSGPRHDPVDSTSTSFFDESISQGTEISVTARVSTSPQELKPALPPRPSVQSLSSQEALALPPMMPPRADSQFSSSSIYSTTLSTAGSDAKPRLPLRPPLLYRDMTSDSTDSNRRPPRSTLYTADISIRSNIKSFAAAKNFVCVGHHAVKVMDATSGVTIPLAQQKQKQEARVTAMAFVPSLDVNNDGEFLWAGFNDGDLWMVRCSTGDVLERRVSAHHHPIAHILRFRRQLWTYDENGVLQIWFEPHPQAHQDEDAYRPDIISLEGRPKTLRIATKQTFAIVVGAQLWSARERIIEVAAPMESASTFKRRVEVPGNYAAISCMAVCEALVPSVARPDAPTQYPDALHDPALYRVFTGHLDGKIIEWDAADFIKRRVFDVGSYRVSSLACPISCHLWVGSGTGKIQVIDVGEKDSVTTSTGIVVLKEWQAETSDAVVGLSVDPDSLVHSGQLLVTSCSKGGSLRVWNALLEDDFVDDELKRREAEYASYHDLSLFIGSWNIDASKPGDLEQRPDDKYLFDRWLGVNADAPDIVVFGLQEIVDLESKKVAAKGFLKNATAKKQESQVVLQHDHVTRASAWKERIVKALKDKYKTAYHFVDSRNLVGLFTCVFVKEEYQRNGLISNFQSYTVSTGLGGSYGNKGAILSRFVLNDSSFCFITSHLPAHQDKVGKRNIDAITIIKSPGFNAASELDLNRDCFARGGDGSQVLDHEYCFFFGDLNYRIDLPRERVERLIDEQDWSALWAADQLIQQRMITNGTCLLRIFEEGPLHFAPTYKYDPGSDAYDTSEKRRTPAWCDRILFRDGASRTLTTAVDPTKRVRLQTTLTSGTGGPQDSNLSHQPTSTSKATTTSAKMLPTVTSGIRQTAYTRLECRVSDHRPIAATFSVNSKRVDQHRKLDVLRAIEGDWQQHYDTVLREASIDWLMRRVDAVSTNASTYRQHVSEVFRLANGDLKAAMVQLLQ